MLNKIFKLLFVRSGIEVALLLMLGCSFLDTNPLDPNGKNYVPPSFTIRSEGDNLGDGDTIHRTWAKLVLEGNRKECRFQIQINEGDTSSPWLSGSEFILKPLPDGANNVLIKCKYNGGSVITSKRISFATAAEGFVPKFFSVIEPNVKADSLEKLILAVQVSGVTPITFTWYKNGEVISGQTQNVLEIERFTSDNVGEYYCVAANEYDSIKGPLIRVQLRKAFTITYNGNGDTSGTVPFDANSYSTGDIITVKGNVGNLRKSGFNFAGWSDQMDGEGTIYNAGTEILVGTQDIVLYAKWVKTMTFAVRYIKNGATSGEVPSDQNLYDPGTIIIVKSNIANLQKKNFTFVGWNTASDGNGKDYAPGVQLTIQNDHVILYAKWTQQIVCRIMYDGNGNTGGTVPVDSNLYELGSTILTRDISETFIKTGFKFAGWNTRADGNGTSYGRDVEFKAQDSLIILYARWTDKETFTITYYGNGNTSGVVPVDINIYEKEDSAVLKKNVGRLAKTGYRFVGWSADKDGNGTKYAPEDLVQILGNTVMYALWDQIITYKVTYNGNNNTGGTVPSDSAAYEDGSKVPVLPNSGALTRTDYVFAGWNTSPDGKGTQLYPGGSFTIDSTITLYARWTKETTYTVSYDANGSTSGAAPVDNNHYVSGEFAIAASNTGNLSKSKNSFAGWNTKPDGSGTSYNAGASFAVTENLILYAKWTLAKTYSITYNGNLNTAGAVPIDPNSYEAGNVAIVMDNTGHLTREGYTFTGWNENADGTGTPHTPNSELKLESQNVALYAVWTKVTVVTFSVTYYGNGYTSGNVPVDNTVYTSGMPATILTNTGSLVRLNFKFAGWSRMISATPDSILMPRDIITVNENVKLFAVWTNKTLYKVVYNANGSSSGAEPKDDNLYLPGVNVTVKGNSGNLIKNGSTFVGWNTKRDGTGTTYTENSKLIKNEFDDTLFAKWSANPTYIIIYNGNNATSGSVPVDANTYEAGVSVVLKNNSGNLVRNGYNFKGWNTKNDGSGKSYVAGASIAMPAQNTELFANWELIPTYTVTYNGNYYTSGSLPVDPNKYATNATVTVKGNTGGLTKTGMTFDGWNTQINRSGIQYKAGDTFKMENSDVVLYAMWTNNPTYTVGYNANGATSGNIPSDPTSYKQGDNVTVKANVGGLARPGYTFDSWNTNSSGTGNKYAPNSSFTMGTSNVSLWAIWKPVSYIVTFDDQSATTHVNPGTITITYPDTTIKNFPAAPIKTGNIFNGWYTSTNGGGVKLSNTTKVTADIKVFANWIPYYNIAYSGNGHTSGSLPVDTAKYKKGDTAIVLGVSTLKKNGYTFANWNSMSNAKGKFYAEKDTLIFGSSAVTLHAAWRATITFDGQGATTGPNPPTISIYHPDTLLPSIPTNPTRTGYEFAGWYTAVSGGTRFIATTKVTGNDTLYARWNIKTYTLGYDGNGSDGGTAPSGGTYDSNTVIGAAANTFTRAGYSFTGWNTAANGSGTAYAASANVTIKGDVTLYAQWSVVSTFTLTYDGNTNTGGTEPATVTGIISGTVLTTATVGTLVKTNYTFAGWNTAANGSGTTYNAGANITITANTILYAQWSSVPTFTLTYDGNTNTSGTVPATVTGIVSGTVLTTATSGTLVKTNYTFAGWNTEADGNGTSYNAGDSVTITANTTLYAQWTAVPTFTLTYDGNTNSGGTAPAAVTGIISGTVLTTATVGTLEKANYTFAGWNTEANGNGTSYNAGASITITANTILYAQWTAVPTFKLTYDGNTNSGGTAPAAVTGIISGTVLTTATVGTLVKANYTFVGWNTEADGNGTSYNAEANITISANTTLYAQWVSVFTLTYDGNANSGGTAPVEVTGILTGSVVTTAEAGTLVKTNSTFAGWNTSADGNGIAYAAGTGITITANITLYAVWTAE